MPIFTYNAIDKSGSEIKSSVTAENENSAKNLIRQKGQMLISIKIQQAQGPSGSRRGIKIEDIALMTRQLSTLVKAKIQIVDCLTALIDQVENQKLRVILSEIKKKVNEGASLANALKDYPKVFNQVYVNMVDAGEASGTLDIVLWRLAEFTEGQMKLKNKIMGAMMYPAIIGTVGFILMNLIFIFVIPKITKIFISMKKELPLQTKICIWISDTTKDYWWAILIGIMFFVWAFRKYTNSKGGKIRWHKTQLKLPVIKKLVVMIDVSRFCSTLATLLSSGVPILTAMRIVKNLVSNLLMQEAVDDAMERVSEGKSMTGPLVASGHFPPMVTHMIGLGEKSGELEPMLQIVSENYENQIDTQLNGLTSILQPIMMLVLGGVVFFIVMAVIVPIMDLNSLRR